MTRWTAQCVALALTAGMLSACAARIEPVTTASAPTVTVAEDDALPANWRAVATAQDLDRIARARDAWDVARAEAGTRFKAAMAAEGSLLEPAVAEPRAAPPPGTYHCRVVRLGAPGQGKAYEAFKPFFCHISVEENLLTFAKSTGTERPAGRLWEDGDKRLIFLGATSNGQEPDVPAYGADAKRNRAGILERVGDFRWRLTMPWVETAKLELIELVPVPQEMTAGRG